MYYDLCYIIQLYRVQTFYFSLSDLILFDEFLAVMYSTIPDFVSIIVTWLYLDDPLLDYFRNCFFLTINAITLYM